MPRSKYPGEFDTSVELPPVRDNVLEVGSDVINSLRSAIFQIERTLGINPQGAIGNTLANRMNRSLDSNGNILSEALDRSDLLTGPIIDSDVSSVAAIKESKLNLDFPTHLLQDQLSILNNQLGDINNLLEEASSKLSAHLNEKAINRHPGTAISISATTSIPEGIASINLESGSVQSAFEDIYNSHINYNGASISEDNNSHVASQIFFDDSSISSIIEANDLQEAVEDLALKSETAQFVHQDLFHSNGILRVGKMNLPDDDDLGNILISDAAITFSKHTGNPTGTSTVTFVTPVTLGSFSLVISDILTISDVNDSDNLASGEYEIAKITLNVGQTEVVSVDVFGLFGTDSTALSKGRLSKNINRNTNVAGLMVAAREQAGLTSAITVQVANPNAVHVVSSGIQPSAITTSNRFFTISIDGGSSITIDAFDGSVGRQSIDSIVSAINEQCAEGFLNILAYRVDYESGGSELAIAHNLPDESGDDHTLSVGRITDDGIDAMGFGSIEDNVVVSEFGSAYYIQGQPFKGLVKKMDLTGLIFNGGDSVVSTAATGTDFIALKIKEGDLLIISDSSSDDGSYVISGITSDALSISPSQLSVGFVGPSDTDTRYRIFESIASFDGITFDEVSSTFGSVLLDIFMDNDGGLFFNKRAEYVAQISGSVSLITLTDFSGDIGGTELNLIASGGTGEITLSLDGGDPVTVFGDNNYVTVISGDENISLELFISDVAAVNSKIISDGADLEIDFFGFERVNDDSNILLARIAYNNFSGRASGGVNAPRAKSILSRGNIGINDLSDIVKHELIEIPRGELRSNGIIYGLEVTGAAIDSNDLYTFEVSRGIAYVAGRRIELGNITLVTTDIDSTSVDKLFIAIDKDGNIAFEEACITCDSPLSDSDNAALATIEFDSTNLFTIDMRLFIDDLDLKLLNSITVSPQSGMAHFNSIPKALKYAKRFSQLYPSAGIPTVHLKSGTYTVESTIVTDVTFAFWITNFDTTPQLLEEFYDEISQSGFFVDFPVNIIGEGDSTVVNAITTYEFTDTTKSLRGSILVPGDGFSSITNPFTPFNNGFIKFEDLKLQNCRIDLLDMNIEDGAPLDFGIEVENVIFDFRNFTANTFDTGLGPVAIRINEVDDPNIDKGNLYIHGCKFIDSFISARNEARIKNLVVAHNFVVGDPDIGLFDSDSDMFDFSITGEEADITVLGNINLGNVDATGSVGGPNLIDGSSSRWGERFSRDVNVGADLNVNNNINVTGEAISPIFKFDSTKTLVKTFFWDNVIVDVGQEIASATATISRVDLNASGIWMAAEISSSESASIRLVLPNNILITQIRLGVDKDGASHADWTIDLYETFKDGSIGTKELGPLTVTGADNGPGSSFEPHEAVFTTSYTTASSQTATDFGIEPVIYLNIKNDNVSALNCYYVEITMESDDIQTLLGVS